MSEIPAALKDILKKAQPPEIPEISKANPFGSSDGAPKEGLGKPMLEDEPMPGYELKLEPEGEPKPIDLDEPEEVEDPFEKLDEKEEPVEPALEAEPEPREEAEEPKPEDALEELAEQRRVNERLRQQVEKMAEEKGGKIPQEFWNLKHRMEEAEEKAKALEKALHKELEKPKQAETPQPTPQPQQGRKKLPGNVCVLFPCMKTTNPILSAILFSLGKDFGDQISLVPRMGDSMIYHSRNVLADYFVEKYKHCDWCLWIDDDMIPPIGNPAFIREHTGLTPEVYPDKLLQPHFLERLMSHKKTIVGATYFGRRSIAPAMFKEGIDDLQAYTAAKEARDEIRPTEWVATGCLLVHRSVFGDIQAKFPQLAPHEAYTRKQWVAQYRNKKTGQYMSQEEAWSLPAEDVTPENAKLIDVTFPARKHWDYFRPDDAGGEDVMFCHRSKAAGHQPYVDTGLHVLHVGSMAFGAHNTANPMLDKSPNKWWA